MGPPEIGTLIELNCVGTGLSYEKARNDVPTAFDTDNAPEYAKPVPPRGRQVRVVSATQTVVAQSERPMDAIGEKCPCTPKFSPDIVKTICFGAAGKFTVIKLDKTGASKLSRSTAVPINDETTRESTGDGMPIEPS
jgi:hypothetical protein